MQFRTISAEARLAVNNFLHQLAEQVVDADSSALNAVDYTQVSDGQHFLISPAPIFEVENSPTYQKYI